MTESDIERAWKRAETREIERIAAGIIVKARSDVAADLSRALYLAFMCGFKTAERLQ